MEYMFKPAECPNRDHPFPEKCGLCGHTSPRSPIIIAGEEFPAWRDAGVHTRRSFIEVTTDAGWGQALMGNLGGYIPGLLEDGTAVEWYVSTVRYTAINEYKALLIPEVQTGKSA